MMRHRPCNDTALLRRVPAHIHLEMLIGCHPRFHRWSERGCKSGGTFSLFIVTVAYLLLAEVLRSRFALSVSCRCRDRCVCSRATRAETRDHLLFPHYPTSRTSSASSSAAARLRHLGMQLHERPRRLLNQRSPRRRARQDRHSACWSNWELPGLWRRRRRRRRLHAAAVPIPRASIKTPSGGTLSMLLGRIRLPYLVIRQLRLGHAHTLRDVDGGRLGHGHVRTMDATMQRRTGSQRLLLSGFLDRVDVGCFLA